MSIEQSLFEGDLICLAPIDHEKDAEVEAGWSNDPEYLRMTSVEPARPQAVSQIRMKYENFEKNVEQVKDRYYFTIRLRTDSRLLGYAEFYWIDWTNGNACLKLAIGKTEDRRKGYGQEALTMMLRFAFHELNLYRISALIAEYNQPAQQLFQKTGFALEVNERQSIHRYSRYWGWRRYGLIRSKWEDKTNLAPSIELDNALGEPMQRIILPVDLFQGNLVRISKEDPKALAEVETGWGLDSEYMRLSDAYAVYPWSRKKIEDWHNQSRKEDTMDRFFFSIRTLSDDRLIGGMGLDGLQWHNRSAWLGIGIGDRNYWGKGYGTDAMCLLVRYGFRELNLHRISLNTFEYNPRAIRCYEKVGFRHEGRVRSYLNRDGKRWDLIYMGILEDEFQYSEV